MLGFMVSLCFGFVSDRSQVVKLKDLMSQPKILSVGVSQGLVLGPLLFLIYLNSIFYIDFNSQLIAFADDLVFMYNQPDRNIITQHMKSDLDLLKNWCCAHAMFLSSKTKGMFFKLSDALVVDPNIVYHVRNCDQIACTMVV